MDFNWIAQTAIMLGIGLIGYFLKATMTEVKNEICKIEKEINRVEDSTNARIEQINRDFNNLKSDLPLVYVTREDHVRQMNSIDRKLDKIFDHITKEGQK
jgi:flagellar capping protein FliD